MELKTEKRKIDDIIFYINQFPARKAIRLEKRTLTFIAPMLKMMDGIKNLDDEVNFDRIANAIQEVLLNVDENSLEQYIFDMIEYTSVGIQENGKEQIIKLDSDNGKVFDNVFRCNSLTVYKLLLEIMSVNKFAFFELMGGGGGKIIGIFGKMMPKAGIS